MEIRHKLDTIFFLVCLNSVVSQLYEGSPCPLETDETGICKPLKSCPSRIEEVRQGKRQAESTRCGFDGFDEIVCCPMTLQEKIGIRPADLACHQYTNEIWAETLTFHILGGTEATAEEFPYMAALGYIDKEKLPKNIIKYSCGGTVISADYVLTAAHCVNNIDNNVPVLVRVGAENLSANALGAQQVRIEEVISHPAYKRSVVYNDIALLKLSSPLKWTSTVKPICLLTKPMDQIEINANKSFVVTGWGATDLDADLSNIMMRTPSLELISRSECSTSYSGFRQIPYGLDENTICAMDGNETRRADACQGDSGGPLLMIDTAGDVIIGITSFGQSCGGPTPAVYTSVYGFLDWIEAQVWPEQESD